MCLVVGTQWGHSGSAYGKLQVSLLLYTVFFITVWIRAAFHLKAVETGTSNTTYLSDSNLSKATLI